MIFDTDYWNALNKKEKEKVTLNPKQLGYSLGGDPLQNLKSGIFMGTDNMELTFFNSPGKGQEKNTPESWGKTERREMKELARVNEVNVSVHATPNMGGGQASFSGFTGREFSDQARQKAVDEMKRTIDFAGDVAEGGPVVLHLDGFPRPIFNLDTVENEKGEKEPMFLQFEEEQKKAPLQYVNTKTGDIQSIPRDFRVPMPIPLKKNGGYKTDSQGNLEYQHDNKDGLPQVKMQTFDEISKTFKKLPSSIRDEHNNNELNYFFSQTREASIQDADSRRHDYGDKSRQIDKGIKELKENLKNYEKNIKTSTNPGVLDDWVARHILPPKEQAKLSEEEFKLIRKDPAKFLKKEINDLTVNKEYYEKTALEYKRQVQQQREEVKSYKSITDYGVKKEADTIALSAMEAYLATKKKHLKKPLFVAPENWQVEQYGSHPKEYRHIIDQSRKNMAKRLLKNKYASTKKEAKKLSEKHIRGTFDIGHANMWKKYYQGDPKKFDKWLNNHVRELTRDKTIGHVHLSDNFGYHDEHIELGEGNAPLQDFFKTMKEEGFKGTMVAEPGGQRKGEMHRVWTSALEMGASPIYRVDSRSKTWTDVDGSYFGQTQSPSFMVGDYLPSKDWALWSETPFE